MPRYNVQSDDKWACFSTISESFITPFMSIDEYEQWRDEEYGRSKRPLEYVNKMSLGEAIFMLSLNHPDDDICENLRYAGILAEREEEN